MSRASRPGRKLFTVIPSEARNLLFLLRTVLLGVLGATVLWAWPWSRDMVVQIITRPQQYEHVAPAGAVAVGQEAPLVREAAATQLRNPFSPSPQTLEQGKKLYDTYCIVCHGAQGRGNGPVAGGALLPADLTQPRFQGQSDGALYSTIRHGFGTMPAYYERLTPRERWLVVLYLRTLKR